VRLVGEGQGKEEKKEKKEKTEEAAAEEAAPAAEEAKEEAAPAPKHEEPKKKVGNVFALFNQSQIQEFTEVCRQRSSYLPGDTRMYSRLIHGFCLDARVCF